MHDISLGHVINDYLTGEAVEATTYEDLRQALARVLVEEKGYPRESLTPRVPVRARVEGRHYTRVVDLLARDAEGAPLLMALFAPGEVTTYEREALAAARLLEPTPAPLVVVTDSKEATLLAVGGGACGERLARGANALPAWAHAVDLAASHPPPVLDERRRILESRILFAYSESLYDCCGGAACAAEGRGSRFAPEEDVASDSARAEDRGASE